jgi:transposase
MTATTRTAKCKASEVLFVAFELSAKSWKLALGTAGSSTPRIVTVAAGARDRVVAELMKAKARFGLAPTGPVVSAYEAGRDGFWIHRWLTTLGVRNHVFDASSIEVPRRARRTKTDRLDAGKLWHLLRRYVGGERACHAVHVPSVADEDRRQVHRALEAAGADRTRAINRLHGVLATQGVRVRITRQFGTQLAKLVRWDGQPLPAGIQQRLRREWAQVEALEAQIATLERARDAAIAAGPNRASQWTQTLQRLRGVDTSAWTFVTELFAWRDFRNGREIGAVTGLAPTLYASGAARHEQGISQAGRRQVRSLAVQIAWQWLRFQPRSALSRWFVTRFGDAGPHAKRIGIVALARKLLIAFWRLLTAGVVPDGAALKPVTR